ncbi:MAG TPA: C39 family peptidase [Terriglobales bacterium]|nr:C39 family peptidase [Terriglobales bacterium]
MTDLFAACARLDPRCVADAIAPAVARGVDVDRAPLADGDDLVIEAGPWIPRTPARHLLPSLALLSDAPCGVRFELSARHGDAWSPWVATATLGDAAFTPQADAANGLRTEIDEVHAAPAVDAVRLRARIGGPGRHAALDAPWLLTLSASDGVLPARDAAADAAPLAVPPRTQMTEPDAVRLRVCSPTSVGMALEYLGCPVPTSTLAAEVFHPPSDRYGLWPAAVRAGAAHGVPGYLLRFTDWATAAWCLGRGLPIVASVRYARGELTGAPMAETSGHLVVITGLEGEDVLVNDPAAATAAEVPRRYRRDEVTRAWLARSGVGYVFFRPPTNA